MTEKQLLKLRKFVPKKRVHRIEKLVIEYGTIVEYFEAGLIGSEQAQNRITNLFKGAIQNNLIAQSNVNEIMSIMVDDRDVFYYLKQKHGVH